MKCLKAIDALALSALLSGCATSYFKVTGEDEDLKEFHVTPDRIVLECEWASTNEGVPYGFMIHILDEANTVLTGIHGSTLSKEDCEATMKKIGRVITRGRDIYIGGWANLKKPRKSGEFMTTFPKHGTFHDNGRSFEYRVIANEVGDCYDALAHEGEPCPLDTFPLKKKAKTDR
jgi:hypothetical protein